MDRVGDRAAAFVAEVQRALAASRAEAGLPPAAAAADLAGIAEAVRGAGFTAALNNMTAAAISHSVSCFSIINSFYPIFRMSCLFRESCLI